MSRLESVSTSFSAKICATYMLAVGLIAGLVYSFGGAIYDATHGGFTGGTALAFLALIGMPILFAIVGLLAGIALAKPVNWFLRRFGGIDLPE